jgi:hypothetical protein
MVRNSCVVACCGFVLLLSACASGGGETLRIDTRDVLGVGHLPESINAMLSELGYEWVPILDPNAHRKVKTVQKDGEWSMRFEYVQNRRVRIDARMGMYDNRTRLHFYEVDGMNLSASSMTLLEKLKQRADRQFGPENVSY